jgi:16S rRNA (cytidine1402-2'-O)-methyltransferase
VDRAVVTAGTLYVVATPLGNLGDLSPRAAATLRTAAIVAAEDTRRARVLLSHLDAHPRLVSFHAHTPPSRIAALVRTLQEGRDVALVTDAGTPAISDPGAALVRAARRGGAAVVAIPGPSAVAAALSIAGLPADRFLFLGFPPRRGTARRRFVETIATAPWTVVLFEAANRLHALLEELAAACGTGREAAVGRELTKLHEELKAGTLNDLAVYYGANPPRGEATVVIAPGSPDAQTEPADPRARAEELLRAGLSRRDAAARVAAECAVSRKEAYRIVTDL